MSLHLSRLIDRIKSAEQRGQREIVISLSDARDIQSDLVKLLLRLQETGRSTDTVQSTEPTGVEISGGSF